MTYTVSPAFQYKPRSEQQWRKRSALNEEGEGTYWDEWGYLTYDSRYSDADFFARVEQDGDGTFTVTLYVGKRTCTDWEEPEEASGFASLIEAQKFAESLLALNGWGDVLPKGEQL